VAFLAGVGVGSPAGAAAWASVTRRNVSGLPHVATGHV